MDTTDARSRPRPRSTLTQLHLLPPRHATPRHGHRHGHARSAVGVRAAHSQVIAEIKEETGNSKVEFLELDLASLASVRQCAETFLARQLPLHLLVNNAGVAQTGLTEDGFESQFGVNHLGHFLLTMLLLDRLKAAAPARIIILTSDMHWLAGSLDWEAVRRPCPRFGVTWGYCLSKLANLLFMDELVRRLEGTHVVVHAVHPGLVATDIIADKDPVTRWLVSFFAVSTDLAVHTILGPAMLPEYGEVTGLYFQGKRSMRPSSKACDPALAARLWKQSEIWTGLAPAAVNLDGGR